MHTGALSHKWDGVARAKMSKSESLDPKKRTSKKLPSNSKVSKKTDMSREEILRAIKTQKPNDFYVWDGKSELIEGGLGDLEDYCLANAAMEHIRKGQETLIGSDQLRQKLKRPQTR